MNEFRICHDEPSPPELPEVFLGQIGFLVGRLAKENKRAFIVAIGTIIALMIGVELASPSEVFAFPPAADHKENEAAPSPAPPPYWHKPVVTYDIVNCPRGLGCQKAHQAVRDVMEEWDAIIDNLSLLPVDQGEQADILIGWYEDDFEPNSPFDGLGGERAHSHYPYQNGLAPIDGDVHFDADEAWVLTTPELYSVETHLPTVARHEIGHALGLPHSSNPASLMWSTYVGVRFITSSDKAAIRAIYAGND